MNRLTSKILFDYMERYELTLDEFLTQMQIPKQLFDNIVNGCDQVTVGQLFALADKMNISAEEFIDSFYQKGDLFRYAVYKA